MRKSEDYCLIFARDIYGGFYTNPNADINRTKTELLKNIIRKHQHGSHCSCKLLGEGWIE